jgi:DNA (cytosine-5)-methyltransferase 3A
MSCGQIALNRAGIKYDKYFSSEVDKYAIKVTQANYPGTVQLGDIRHVKGADLPKIDLILAGSPCQGFSVAGKGLNFEDPRSALFFEFVRLLKECKPKYFLLENVIMRQEHNDVISGILGDLYPECVEQGELFRTGRLEPIRINASLVSAQNRDRLFWTNIPNVTQPEDKGIMLKDILESGEGMINNRGKLEPRPDKAQCLDANYWKGMDNHGQRTMVITGGRITGRNPDNPKSRTPGIPTVQMLEIKTDHKSNCLSTVAKDSLIACCDEQIFEANKKQSLCIQVGKADLNGHDHIKRVYSPEGKAPCLCTGTSASHEPKVSTDVITWRKLTPLECERLQCVAGGYTSLVSNSQRYRMLGNGWNVDVITHILKGLKQP